MNSYSQSKSYTKSRLKYPGSGPQIFTIPVLSVLDTIEHAVFDRLLSRIELVSPSASVDYLRELNFTANVYISHFHQIIGIILRSTNARNSFEIYDPLLRLAKGLLGNDTVLILSSEWDFIPFTMPSVFGGVPNCTVVGLPVMEAANALLTPLAGHELGHAVWRSKKLNDETDKDRKDALCEVFLEDWNQFKKHVNVNDEAEIHSSLREKEWGVIPLALLQDSLDVMEKVCEEIFCDMLGVRLFGMGYLYAFEYLAAPSLGATELREYPFLDARARYLAEAVSAMAAVEVRNGARPENGGSAGADDGPSWPRLTGYAMRFSEEADPLDPDDQFQFVLRSAHRACERLVDRLRTLATEVCGAEKEVSVAIPSPRLDGAVDALKKFRRGLPAVGNLADLVNAGWLGYLDPDFWSERSTWKGQKFRFLNELVFKSLDVTEYHERRREDALKIGQAGAASVPG